MTLTDLIKSAEEKLTNPDLTLGARRREEAILHHLTSLERTVAEFESQNTELYADLCEMGDMARERNRMRDAVIGVDLAGGVDYTVDHLIRHKWPEEKPEKGGQYLIRIISPSGSVYYRLRGYEDGEWHNFGNYLTHWWNLPEVTE